MKTILAAAILSVPLMLGACASIDLSAPTDKAPSQLRAERAERRAAKHTFTVRPAIARALEEQQTEQALDNLQNMSEASW